MNDKRIDWLFQTREEFLAELLEKGRPYREEMDRILGRIPGGALDRYRAGRDNLGEPVDLGNEGQVHPD